PKHNVDGVSNSAQIWATVPNPEAGVTAVEHLTFNAPVDAGLSNQCGRAVFTDVHTGSGDTGGAAFPSECVSTGLTPAERALAFTLFDLSSCVLSDQVAPQPLPLQ